MQEVGDNLATWMTEYAVPDTATAGPPVAVAINLDGTITLRIPRDPEKKFARLKVAITP